MYEKQIKLITSILNNLKKDPSFKDISDKVLRQIAVNHANSVYTEVEDILKKDKDAFYEFIYGHPKQTGEEVEVTRFEKVTGWERVVNAARRTVGKGPLGHEPSNKFKKKILLAEHSPIRLLEYEWSWKNIMQWVTVHLVRHHEGCEKFVHTQREDRTVLPVPRNELPQGAENDMDMTANAQAFINISRKRCCMCASKETRIAWRKVLDELKKVDPVLWSVCVPECVYRGFCPEFDRSCGYVNTPQYKKRLEEYRNPEV